MENNYWNTAQISEEAKIKFLASNKTNGDLLKLIIGEPKQLLKKWILGEIEKVLGHDCHNHPEFAEKMAEILSLPNKFDFLKDETGECQCPGCLAKKKYEEAGQDISITDILRNLFDENSQQPLNQEEWMREVHAQIFDKIQEIGFVSIGIVGDPESPDYIYTTGFTDIGHSELIMFSVHPDTAGAMYENIHRELKSGEMERLEVNTLTEKFSRPGSDLRFGLVDVSEENFKKYALQTNRYYQHSDKHPKSIQIVFPDDNGLFPWDDGEGEKFEQFKLDQPILGEWLGLVKSAQAEEDVEIKKEALKAKIQAKKKEMSDIPSDSLTFTKLNRDGTESDVKVIPRAMFKMCPHTIIAAEHYNEDGTCNCFNESSEQMKEWGYRWSKSLRMWR